MEVDVATMNQYQSLRQELQALSEKLTELEMDADEHRLVVAALTPLAPTRKCWRRVGGILVESSVEQTLPILTLNLQGV
jgi:prefoldin subunit 2